MEELKSLSDVFNRISQENFENFIKECDKYSIEPAERMLQIIDEIRRENEEEYKGAYKKINTLVDLLRGFQLKGMDVMAGVSSFKGFGKTTFGYQVGNRFMLKYLGKSFDFEENQAYDNFDVLDKVKSAEKYSFLNLDEAVEFALGEDWNKYESKLLKKIFTKIRTKHLIMNMNIPDFWWFDSKYRGALITLRVHLVIRGYGVLYVPDLRDGIDDRWHRKELIEDTKPFNYFSKLKAILPSYRRHPCYNDDFAIPKMPIREEKKYLKIRNQHIFNGQPVKDDVVDTVTSVFYNLRKSNPNYSYRKLEALSINPIHGHKTIDKDTIRLWLSRFEKKIQEKAPAV